MVVDPIEYQAEITVVGSGEEFRKVVPTPKSWVDLVVVADIRLLVGGGTENGVEIQRGDPEAADLFPTGRE